MLEKTKKDSRHPQRSSNFEKDLMGLKCVVHTEDISETKLSKIDGELTKFLMIVQVVLSHKLFAFGKPQQPPPVPALPSFSRFP